MSAIDLDLRFTPELIVRFMLRKLYSLVAGSSCADNPDSPQHHEVLLPGFLYGMIIKERFDEALSAIKAVYQMDVRLGKAQSFTDCKALWCRIAHASSLLQQTCGQSQLGYRIKIGLFPCYRKSRLADRSRSATNLRLYDRR